MLREIVCIIYSDGAVGVARTQKNFLCTDENPCQSCSLWQQDTFQWDNCVFTELPNSIHIGSKDKADVHVDATSVFGIIEDAGKDLIKVETWALSMGPSVW